MYILSDITGTIRQGSNYTLNLVGVGDSSSGGGGGSSGSDNDSGEKP